MVTARQNRLDDGGIDVVCLGPQGRAGDVVEAYAGDDLLGAAPLRRGAGGRWTARIRLADVPMLAFPARVRLLNRRSGDEIGGGPALADATALIALAGPPATCARFVGMRAAGPAFAVTTDRLPGYARAFVLRLDGGVVATALSCPRGTDDAQDLAFEHAGPVPPGTAFEVLEARFGVVALAGRFDAEQMLAGTVAELAALTQQVAALHDAHAHLRRRLDAAIGIGRERLLLDRLDLFYLLLAERIERAGLADRPPPLDGADGPKVVRYGPAEIDGLGLFELEGEGAGQWRWFGPEVTLALRGLPGPARRVVLYFHHFGKGVEAPHIRASTGGGAEPARLRALQGCHAVDIPLTRDGATVSGMLIVHLSFDRHETSVADPRPRAAVFSGAEVFLAPPSDD